MAGGPDEIHLALGDALGDAGTLVMYASCPRHVDEIGRGNLDAARERELLEKPPAFDPYTARAARENGALVELVRNWPGARVNAHPARFRVPVLEDGRRAWRWMAEYDTADGVHANWPPDFFARIVDGYLRHTGNAGGRVGDAPSHLFPARELLDFALPVMRAVAHDRAAADALVPRDGPGA